jgi:hypothetical protein
MIGAQVNAAASIADSAEILTNPNGTGQAGVAKSR